MSLWIIFVVVAFDLLWHIRSTYLRQRLVEPSDMLKGRELIRTVISENWCPYWKKQTLDSRHFFLKRKHVSGRTVLSRKKLVSRISVSEKLKIVYCPIPKAASSTWKYLIRCQEGVEDYWNLTAAHSRATSGLKYLIDYPSEEIERILTSPEYLKFTFVRNPYTRLLSCYVDKFRNKNKDSSEYRTFIGHLFGWWDENLFENYSLTSEERSLMKKQKYRNKALKGPRPSFS
ncbi:Carbohydrate sulfotransferase 14 [Galdieria sulphuraria]|nr:Carbohydrate sulfotransferase 14 [Galdieria sulphuraria]